MGKCRMPAAMEWKPQYCLGVAFMDRDHEDSVKYINDVVAATSADTTAAFDRLICHFEEHFQREYEAMDRAGFFALHCHADEHARVLTWLRDLRAKATPERLRLAAETDIAIWLLQHLDTMDRVTARFVIDAGMAAEMV